MLVFYLSPTYLLAMTGWLAVMAGLLIGLLRWRRSRRLRSFGLVRVNLALSLWLLLATVTAAELMFALFVDHSDAFNITNVSKRWLKRHIDDERNQAGFRDAAEFTEQIPDGMRRIAFFGDSFTVGHGIRDVADRFTDRTGARLEEVHPGKYVVANLGEPGYEASLIEGLVRATLTMGYDVDMVVYVYNLNDIEGYDQRTTEAIQSIGHSSPRFFLFRDTYFLNWLYFRYLQFNQPGVSDYFPHLVDSYESKPWEGLRRKLIQLHNDCKQHDVELRMVIFPFLQSLGPDYDFLDAHRKMVEFCREQEIPVLDLEPVFRDHVDDKLTVNPFDAHPNERAHEIAAEAIERDLLQDLFADDGSQP